MLKAANKDFTYEEATTWKTRTHTDPLGVLGHVGCERQTLTLTPYSEKERPLRRCSLWEGKDQRAPATGCRCLCSWEGPAPAFCISNCPIHNSSSRRGARLAQVHSHLLAEEGRTPLPDVPPPTPAQDYVEQREAVHPRKLYKEVQMAAEQAEKRVFTTMGQFVL